ncbi:MAG: hypothetical protein CM15mP120_09120 [Pseudomonadota bacterium]|nr:MAG: hypothetical protein CM15mP120_09120 [Pseudomonadota bacterium]
MSLHITPGELLPIWLTMPAKSGRPVGRGHLTIAWLKDLGEVCRQVGLRCRIQSRRSQLWLTVDRVQRDESAVASGHMNGLADGAFVVRHASMQIAIVSGRA